MGSGAARLVLHTILFFPSVFIWGCGGWAVAFLAALWASGHYRWPLSSCVAIFFYPFTGWFLGITDAWGAG